jgi:hypothetical protein
MYFVITMHGAIVETSEEVEEIKLDELEDNPDSFYGYSEYAQQYLMANYPEYTPEEEKEKEIN